MRNLEANEVLEILLSCRQSFSNAALPSAITLLIVSGRPGITATELGALGRTKSTSFYRHVKQLKSASGRLLLRLRPHTDGRANAIYLSRAGQEIVSELCRARPKRAL